MKIEIPSDFIKTGINIHHGERVVLLDEGEYREIKGSDGKKKKVLQFQLQLSNGEVKIYTMNITTQRGLILAFGEDSKNWIDKVLEVNILKQLAFGKMIDVLVLLPTTGEKKMPETEEISVVDE